MLQTLREHGHFTHSLDPSRHICILALSSTISRLVAGLLSDYISSPNRTHPRSRLDLLIPLCFLHVAAFFVISYAPVDWLREWFSLASVLVGISYGGIFTLAPTIVSVVWGIGDFGRHWGILTFTPGNTPPPTHQTPRAFQTSGIIDANG
jgi:MFS family permease